jgi:hypothetical protein
MLHLFLFEYFPRVSQDAYNPTAIRPKSRLGRKSETDDEEYDDQRSPISNTLIAQKLLTINNYENPV